MRNVLGSVYNVVLPSPAYICEYVKTSSGYVTGCKARAAGYNKHWKVCPYCGCNIYILNRKASEPYSEKYSIPDKIPTLHEVIISMDAVLEYDPALSNKKRNRSHYQYVFDAIRIWRNKLIVREKIEEKT